MNFPRLLLFLIIGTLLSSCQSAGVLGISGDHEKKTDEVHQAISALYERHTYGTKYNPCLAIGSMQPENAEICFYVITIEENHNPQNYYKGKYSHRACDQNRRSGNPFQQCDEAHWKPATHMFKVNGTPEMRPRADYDLYSQPGSDVLTCHDPNTPAGRPSATCVERTTDLDAVQ
jgi:hypothetical protein